VGGERAGNCGRVKGDSTGSDSGAAALAVKSCRIAKEKSEKALEDECESKKRKEEVNELDRTSKESAGGVRVRRRKKTRGSSRKGVRSTAAGW
jgi:hypothetical protein